MPNGKNLKCRLCLVESENGRMKELFDKNYTNNSNSKRLDSTALNQHLNFSKLPFNEKVEYCCGVKLLPKSQMPTKICAKCINMIDMWYNFRQMCFNSQEFLASQLKVAQAQNSVMHIRKEPEEMQIDLKPINIVDINESDDSFDDADYIEVIENNEGSPQEEEFLYLDDNNTNSYQEFVDTSQKKEQQDSVIALNQKLFESDLSEALSPEDIEEAINILSAENDENMERLIEHAATKNTALRMLRRKAIGSVMREKQPKKSATKKQAKEKPMKPSIFMCNICGNVYSKKPLFQYHMRMHSEIKPYQCELCNNSYRIMSDLKNHMYRHTGERPFKCKHCDRHFMDRSSRHRHERIHTNSRPYTCNLCNKSFTYSAILKNHLKRHTGEKDYICAVCNKSFTLAHQLKAHMLTLTHRQKEAAFEAQGYKVIYEASEMTKS